MPAAAVIPAPIAYIKVAAVKKLVVGIYFSDRGVCAFKNKNFIFLPIHYMVARMVVNVFIYISSIARLKFVFIRAAPMLSHRLISALHIQINFCFVVREFELLIGFRGARALKAHRYPLAVSSLLGLSAVFSGGDG